MYLRRVELHGFKSFADRQRFEFGPGVTAVVGPNGSGKSNVADAVRWALGEQSARSIRARKTEDIIFSGSDKRRPLGAAEVTLVLDNDEGWMPVDFSEVTVTRRAYRSGESEYLINGQKVRLLDVQDLFRRAQVGQNSYAMMSQGLVDEVLALRPTERRNLIEEAADVHRHRLELTRAERRLTETRDNLGHVRMLIREVEPRLRQLERQSTRAERYRLLAAQLADVLQVYYEGELRAAQEALAAARARHDQQARAFTAAEEDLAEVGARLAAVDREVQERRARLDQAQAAERALTEEGLRLQQAVALAEQRLELLAERQRELEAELAAAPPAAPEGADAAAELAALDARIADAGGALEREHEALRAADEAARSLLRALAEAEARRTRLESEQRDAERRMATAESAARELAAARAAAGERRAELLARLRVHGQRALALHRERLSARRAADAARSRRAAAEAELERALAEASEGRDAVQRAAARIETLEARQRWLAELDAQAPDATAAAQALLAAARERDADGQPRLAGVAGTIARLLRVPEGLERAIEAALAEQLSAIVVDRERDALAAIAYLREQRGGALSFFPLDRVPHQYPLNLFSERGVVGVAARLVRCEQRFRPLVDTLLGRTIIVEDLATAQRMIGRGLGAVVTRDGVLLRPNGSLYGGGASAGGEQLALAREADALPAAIAAAREALAEAEERSARADDAAAAARAAAVAAREQVDAIEAQRRELEEARTLLRRDLGGVAPALHLVHATLARPPAVGGDAAALRAELAKLAAALEAAHAEIATLRDRAEAVSAERDAAAARVTAATSALASAEGERDAYRERRAEREQERRALLARIEQRRAQAGELRREREDVALSLRDLRERLANNRAALAAAEEAVGPAHAALADALGEQRELGAARGDAQARRFAAEREVLAADGDLRQHAQRVQSLLQQIADEGLTVTPDGRVLPGETPAAASPALADVVPAAGGAEVDPEELRQRISDLRAEIRALGPVNLEALDDLAEERERHRFLSGQVADLEAAEAELRQAIRDLERLIRGRFDETFARVNASFGEYFRRFFGGGHAELRIVEPEEEGGDAGVEIVAQPPGKRIASLNVLSGGERALTSVALLFALLAVNPAPVCVLDEVDAALDEANVGRFVDTLRELTERSQFIVITHNRRTTEAADTIYGVSMGEESTSRVLSLRVEDLPRAS